MPACAYGTASCTKCNGTCSAVLNLTGNTLNIAAGSAAIVVTGGAQVKQGP